jgi:hypothetical protein
MAHEAGANGDRLWWKLCIWGGTKLGFTLLCAPPLAEARQDTNDPFKTLVTDDLIG